MQKYFVIFMILVVLSCANATFAQQPETVFIKGGTFTMGDWSGYDDEKPAHPVTLSDFYMGKYEVTNDQYKKFVTATGHELPSYWEKTEQKGWFIGSTMITNSAFKAFVDATNYRPLPPLTGLEHRILRAPAASLYRQEKRISLIMATGKV